VTTSDRLDALRHQLDDLDRRLLEAVRDRIECCVEIARYKRAHGVPMMQPHRIEAVHRNAAAFAAEHGIDDEFLRRLYDLIITETCRVEDLVISGGEPA
jgi:chorismate mutase-like protein